MPSYKVLRTVVHGQKVQEPGSSLTLSEEQAHQLVVKGYVEPVKKPEAAKR